MGEISDLGPQMLAGSILSFGVDGRLEPVHIYLIFPGMLDLILAGNRRLFTDYDSPRQPGSGPSIYQPVHGH